MSSDSDSQIMREENLVPHELEAQENIPSSDLNNPSHQEMMCDPLPDSPQLDQFENVEMEDIHLETSHDLRLQDDSQSLDQTPSEETPIIETGFDAQDEFVEPTIFLPGPHVLNECACFDPAGPFESEFESETGYQAQPENQEAFHLNEQERSSSVKEEQSGVNLNEQERSPRLEEAQSEGSSDSSLSGPRGPSRRVPNLGPHYIPGPARSDGRDSTPILADPRILTPKTFWQYMIGKADALGNPRVQTPIEEHIARQPPRQFTPRSESSESTSESESSYGERRGPSRNVPPMWRHYIPGPPRSDGRESTPILADPRLLNTENLWRYIRGEIDAAGNSRTPSPVEVHNARPIPARVLTPRESSDSSTSSEEEERSIRELLVPSVRPLDRSRSFDTESSLEYVPAIKSESDEQDQRIESREPTPGPGWSDGISHEQSPDLDPKDEPMEEEYEPEIKSESDSQGQWIESRQSTPGPGWFEGSSNEEKPDINPEYEPMEDFNGDELRSSSNRRGPHQSPMMSQRQLTPGPSRLSPSQQNPGSGNPFLLSPNTFSLWRSGLVDSRGRPQTPVSVRFSSPCLAPSLRNRSSTSPRREEANPITQDLEITTEPKPKGKKRKNQTKTSTQPTQKKRKTKQVKKSKKSKKEEDTQVRPTDVPHTISPPALAPTPSRPQPEPELSQAADQLQTESQIQIQRPARALRARREDGRAATNLRSRGFQEGIGSNQNKKKRGGKKLKQKIEEEEEEAKEEEEKAEEKEEEEVRMEIEVSSSRNLNVTDDQVEEREEVPEEMIEDVQPVQVISPPRPPRRLILRVRSPRNPVQNQEGIENPRPEVQSTTPPRPPRRLILRVRSPSNTVQNQEGIENAQPEFQGPTPPRLRSLFRVRSTRNPVENQEGMEDQVREEVVEDQVQEAVGVEHNPPELQVTEPSRRPLNRRLVLLLHTPGHPVNRI